MLTRLLKNSSRTQYENILLPKVVLLPTFVLCVSLAVLLKVTYSQ